MGSNAMRLDGEVAPITGAAESSSISGAVLPVDGRGVAG
jgi:hypothetical protein